MIEWQGERTDTKPQRRVGEAMWRGILCRCPNCARGTLFRAYLKPVDNCGHCNEDMTHQRADDAPPYFTMVIVGHIVVPIMLAVAMRTELSNMTHLMMWIPLSLVLTLALLQPVKGAIIGLQWALYMHGFGDRTDSDALPEVWPAPKAG